MPNISEPVVLHTSSSEERTHEMLKTAIATVRSDDHATDAHILFDEGAQCSFVTHRRWRLYTYQLSVTLGKMYDIWNQQPLTHRQTSTYAKPHDTGSNKTTTFERT